MGNYRTFSLVFNTHLTQMLQTTRTNEKVTYNCTLHNFMCGTIILELIRKKTPKMTTSIFIRARWPHEAHSFKTTFRDFIAHNTDNITVVLFI